MTVVEPVVDKCTNCGSTDLKKIKSRDIEMDLMQCKKCKAVRDVGLIVEDEKHRVYHESGKEPTDKRNI